MKISIIGSGSWGTALAQVASDNQHDVLIWGRSPEEVNDIQNNHQNSKYFGDLQLAPEIQATTDFDRVLEADVILLAVPTVAIEMMAQTLNEQLNKAVIIVNVAKGFHPTTHELLSDVIKRSFTKEHLQAVVSLIGPSHAEDVVLRKLTSVNAVSDDKEAAKIIQTVFSNTYFRVYRNYDTIGAQIGVAIKNIISIASGIATGLDLGDNARAALITRGLAEMTRYGVALGGKAETFLGLCGVGDLVVTCTSPHSRNFQAGFAIGQANSAQDFMEHNTKTVEGVFATKVVYQVAQEKGIEMPITHEVYEILYFNKPPSEAISDLMRRDLKEED